MSSVRSRKKRSPRTPVWFNQAYMYTSYSSSPPRPVRQYVRGFLLSSIETPSIPITCSKTLKNENVAYLVTNYSFFFCVYVTPLLNFFFLVGPTPNKHFRRAFFAFTRVHPRSNCEFRFLNTCLLPILFFGS